MTVHQDPLTEDRERSGRPLLTIGIMVVAMAGLAVVFWLVQKRILAEGARVPDGPAAVSR